MTKRTDDGMWFLPQDSRVYGSVDCAYLVGSRLVFIGGGATLGWGQEYGMMMEDQTGANSSLTVAGGTEYSHYDSTVSKPSFAKLLTNGTSLDYIQVDVSNGKVTNVYF